jgi:hypothetical protein
LTADQDAETRFEAIQAMRDWGGDIPQFEIRKLLVRTPLNAFTSQQTPDLKGESLSRKFTRLQLAQLGEKELENLSKMATDIYLDAYFTLCEARPSRYFAKLRSQIEDQFDEFFDEKLNELTTGEISYPKSVVDSVENSKELLKQDYKQSASRVICKRGTAADLDVVRVSLSDPDILPEPEHFEFLGRFGEWSDLVLVDALSQRRASAFNGLLALRFDTGDWVRPAAVAAYSIARLRLAELADSKISPRLTAATLKLSSRASFNSLTDDQISTLFGHDDLQIRRTSAILAVQFCTKSRIKRLLRDYILPEKHQYYNVIHWLDLGISLSAVLAHSICQKALH